MPASRVWAVLGCCAALSACSGDDHPPPIATLHPLPECPDHDYSTCDTRDAACQARLFDLAVCVYGASSKPDVPVRVVTEEQLIDELNESGSEAPDDDADLPHIERTLVDLALLQPGDLTQHGGSTAQIVASIDGVYQDAEHGIALVDRGSPQSNVDADSVLFHEFVHALQDAAQDLQAWRQQYPDDVDSSLALRTVTEGQATYAQYRVIVAMAGDDVTRFDWERQLTQFRNNLTTRALDDPSPYFAAVTTFPYGYGVGLAREAWSDHTGQFENPPLATWQALSHDAGEAFSPPPELKVELPVPDDDYALVDDTVLGALMLQLSTHRMGATASDALELALAWRGDKLAIYAGPDQQTAWLWQLELSDAAHATALAKLAEAYGGLQVTAQNARVFLSSKDPPAFVSDAAAAFSMTP